MLLASVCLLLLAACYLQAVAACFLCFCPDALVCVSLSLAVAYCLQLLLAPRLNGKVSLRDPIEKRLVSDVSGARTWLPWAREIEPMAARPVHVTSPVKVLQCVCRYESQRYKNAIGGLPRKGFRRRKCGCTFKLIIVSYQANFQVCTEFATIFSNAQ